MMQVVLPDLKHKRSDISANELTKQIQQETRKFMTRAEHSLHTHRSSGLQRRLERFVDLECASLMNIFAQHPASVECEVFGAALYLITTMQEITWEMDFIPGQYRPLLNHLWYGMDLYAEEMHPMDTASALYAFACYKDYLEMLVPQPGDFVRSDVMKKSERVQQFTHLGLVQRLVKRFMENEKAATAQDALSVLLGMAAVYYRDEGYIKTLIDHHLIHQIPILDHDTLGQLSIALGMLRVDNPHRIMTPLMRRFHRLKEVDCYNIEIDTFANLIYGVGLLKHQGGKGLAIKLIKYLVRSNLRIWRPRTISRLAHGVAKLDAHNPIFIGTILRETIRSGSYFNQSEIRMFQEAIDEMNIEPSDEVWKSLSTKQRASKKQRNDV